ncbi:hypothetical protein ECZU29_63340 [Escherichia coli]|nr:hypothetical protein ECZU29_63340 [Escherichia coli]
MIAVLAISFCWCYGLNGNIIKDKIKEAWTTLNEFYGLDYVQMAIQRLIGFGEKRSLKFWQF